MLILYGKQPVITLQKNQSLNTVQNELTFCNCGKWGRNVRMIFIGAQRGDFNESQYFALLETSARYEQYLIQGNLMILLKLSLYRAHMYLQQFSTSWKMHRHNFNPQYHAFFRASNKSFRHICTILGYTLSGRGVYEQLGGILYKLRSAQPESFRKAQRVLYCITELTWQYHKYTEFTTRPA